MRPSQATSLISIKNALVRFTHARIQSTPTDKRWQAISEDKKQDIALSQNLVQTEARREWFVMEASYPEQYFGQFL